MRFLKLIFKPSSFELLIQYLHVFLQCNFFCACVLEEERCEVITEDTQRHVEAVFALNLKRFLRKMTM